MNSLRKKIPNYKILACLIFVFTYVLSMMKINSIGDLDDIGSGEIFLYSWLGIVVFLFYIFWWKKLTGKFLTPFTIFLLFITLFNFGQCILWAFGIHSDSEIGNALILKAQILYVVSYVAINTGAILLYKKKKVEDMTNIFKDDVLNDFKYKALFATSAIVSLYSIPITIFVAIQKYRYTQIFSYHDIYYGSINEYFSNPIFTIGCGLFFMSLVGLLIGSKYKKNVRYFVYSVFFVYATITLLGGDRGEWIVPFMFLFWMHITFYKPMKRRNAMMFLVVSFLSLYIMNAIVSLRNVGISYDGFVDSLTSNDGVIVPLLTEFGQTMGISIILLSKGTVPLYGNTYLMSIPTMFGTGFANRLFGMNYVQLHTWFPLEYLGINYGTDFSVIGEAVLNYGVLLAPLVLLVGGMIFGKIFNYPFEKNKSPFLLCFSIGAMISIVGIARSTFWISLNKIVWPLLVFGVIYFVMKRVYKRMDNHQNIDVKETIEIKERKINYE